MDVACSSLCFSREPFERCLRHIAEMEFSRVDLAIGDADSHVTIGDIVADPAGVVQRIRQGPTLGFCALTARLSARGEALSEQLDTVAHLAKQLAAPVIVIDAAPADTPIETEVSRLARLVRTVSLHGAVLAVTTKTGTLTENPDTATALCEKVDGLGLTLDPSHFICGPHQGKPFDQVFPYVRHVHLRDTGRGADQFQVRVGRGQVEYGRIVASLSRYSYQGALVVAIEDQRSGDLDVESEVRKLQLLLESLL